MEKDEDRKKLLEIANNVRNLREERGFTQLELAKKAGLNSNFLAKIERGESKPSGITITKLAKALGVKSSEILGI